MISPRVDALQSLREYAQDRFPGRFSIETQVIRQGRFCVSIWVFGEAGEEDMVRHSAICQSIREAAASLREELCEVWANV